MAKSRPDTIILRGDPLIKEGVTLNRLFPGHLVEVGGTEDVKLQSAAKQNCLRDFVLENINFGKEVTDPYEAKSQVRYGSFSHGMELQARVKANAPAIVRGDPLESAGDGTVVKLTDGIIIAYALESVDNSSNNTETMIKIEVC